MDADRDAEFIGLRCSSHFHSRTRGPLLPPLSAVMVSQCTPNVMANQELSEPQLECWSAAGSWRGRERTAALLVIGSGSTGHAVSPIRSSPACSSGAANLFIYRDVGAC
jgi:hypothetical protein